MDLNLALVKIPLVEIQQFGSTLMWRYSSEIYKVVIVDCIVYNAFLTQTFCLTNTLILAVSLTYVKLHDSDCLTCLTNDKYIFFLYLFSYTGQYS